MISKDSMEEKKSPVNKQSEQSRGVNEELKRPMTEMSSKTVIRVKENGEGSTTSSNKEVDLENSDVHSLLGRSFKGDLIASQVYLCITCGIELDDSESLRRHELTCISMDNSTNPNTTSISLEEGEGFRKLVCEICRAYFTETDHLQEHKLLHLNSSNVCYLCDTYYANRYLLARHVVCQHSERFGVKQNEEGVHEPYTCAICILRFSTLIALQAHEDSHGITEKMPTCRVCSVSNANHQALQSHLKSSLHAEMKLQLQNLFTCIDCSTVFHCRDAYAMHMMMRAKDESCKKTHKIYLEKSVEKPNSTVVIVKEEPNGSPSPDCQEIDPFTNFQDNRAESVGSMSECSPSDEPRTVRSGQVCPGCGMLCSDSNHLLRHLRMCGSVLSPQQNGAWLQSQNGLVFKWAVNKTYSLHLPATMARKEKQCSYCQKTFTDQDDLAMHVMSDHSEDVTEPERTSPPETNVWRPSKMTDPLPIYSPSTLFIPQGGHLRSPNKVLNHDYHVDSKYPLLVQTGDNPDEKQLSEVDVTSSNSINDLSDLVSPTQLNRKRHYGRSQSVAIHNNRMDESRSKSADVVTAESDRKQPRLSTPPGRFTQVSHYSPLDLSKGLRETILGKCMDESSLSYDKKKKAQDDVTEEPRIPPRTQPTNVISETTMGQTSNVVSDITDQEGDPPLLEFLLDNRKKLFQCAHCQIVFFDRTLYCLHMGLHNVNNPWQCNMCGKAFDTVHQFSSHVLHF